MESKAKNTCDAVRVTLDIFRTELKTFSDSQFDNLV